MDLNSMPVMIDIVKYVGFPALLFYLLKNIIDHVAAVARELIALSARHDEQTVAAMRETTGALQQLSAQIMTNQFCPMIDNRATDKILR